MRKTAPVVVMASLLAATAFAQITDETAPDTVHSSPAVSQETVVPNQSVADRTASSGTMSRKQTDLYQSGQAQRGAGIALASVGGVFMGVFVVYTVMFLAEPRTYGISMGSTSSGYTTTEFYFNPGFIALPIAAPCLALGIVNSIKGKKKMARARNPEESRNDTGFAPYLAFNPLGKTYRAGVALTF